MSKLSSFLVAASLLFVPACGASVAGIYELDKAELKKTIAAGAEGKPDKAIALKLDLSLRTIQLRRASVMRKMHARSRAELIRLVQVLEHSAVQNSG